MKTNLFNINSLIKQTFVKNTFSNANTSSNKLKNIFKNSIYFSINKNYYEKTSDGFITSKEIKKKLEKKYGLNAGDLFSNDAKDAMHKYEAFVKEREFNKLNYNRKNRWEQRVLDDIYKNFDIKLAKFKDFKKVALENKILNNKKFNSSEEVIYYIKDLLTKTDYLSEDVISNALDAFIKDFNKFKEEDLKNDIYKNFIKQIAINLTSFTKDSTIIKCAKFLDWYNVPYRNCWYNLERVVTNKAKTEMSSVALINVLGSFASQNEGSGEFYDLYQYLFWCNKFHKCNLNDLISLAYYMFITDQGYDVFYHDISKIIMERIDNYIDTFDIIRILQIYSNISDMYPDFFYKLEEIILKRTDSIDLNEASMLSCAFSISGYGTPDLYVTIENKLINRFNEIDKSAFREVVRGYIISNIGSDKLFILTLSDFINNPEGKIPDFTITEYAYIMKAYYDRLKVENYYKNLNLKTDTLNKLFAILENKVIKMLKNPKDVLLEEICSICHYYCLTKNISRDFQKVVEELIKVRIVDIRTTPKVNKFLYDNFLDSGMCSPGLIGLLYENHAE